jgi:hypothetical protein
MKIQSEIEKIEFYRFRNNSRELTLHTATMNFIDYFIDLGDDDITAKNKVSELSTEVNHTLYGYILGNTKPLFDAINNTSLSFMNDDAKTKIITYLTI